ncbi:protein PML-like isoform X3 [Heterodontus francisci]|uniref:protein PML-like isoform X3 n=1 Tax=Heterodontus francisci TaxID=7792 RepID=UPI00355C61B1
MMETASEVSLAAEKFECGVCCKQLDRPKLLPCLHSFCQECLWNEWTSQSPATCPVCSAPTDGEVINIQDNTFIANLVSKLQLRKRIGMGLDIWCSLCQAFGDDRPATSMCFECDRFLCLRCCHSHQVLTERYGHLVKTLDNLRMFNCEDFVTLAKNEEQTVCPAHKEQHIRFFCKTCSVSICCNCLLLYHISPDHCYHDIKQEVVLRKGELKQMMDTTQENHNTFTEIYTQLKSLQQSLDNAQNETEALIKQKASTMIQEISKQGDALLRELETECNLEESRLAESLKQTEQIIKRMGAGKELAGKMLKFGTNEEMMEMYKTIKSALTTLVAKMPIDESKEATLIEFIECTLETQNLLGTLIHKKEQGDEAGDSEAEETLVDMFSHHYQERTSTGEGPANLRTLPVGKDMVLPPLLRATVASTDEAEFEDMVSPTSCSQGVDPGPSGIADSRIAPFTRVEGQLEWAGEEEEGLEQPLSPGPDSSARSRDMCPSGPSFIHKLTQKLQKFQEKLQGKRSWSVEDENASTKKQYLHSEHNYSAKGSPTLTSDSKAELLSQSNSEGSTDIVQLSAVSGEKIFNKYILPSNPMSPGAVTITGIQIMGGILYLRGEPQLTCSLQEAMTAFLQFLQSLDRPLLAGHNIWVRDCQIIYKVWGDLFMKDQFARCVTGFLDTIWLARDIVPRSKVKNYKLKNLVAACVGELFATDGTLNNVKALQELYSVLNPIRAQTWRSQFSLSQLECRVTLQPLFDQEVISRLVADKLAFQEISLNILQLVHYNDPQSGLRELVRASGNLELTNPQLVINKIRLYLELQKVKCRNMRQSVKVENK